MSVISQTIARSLRLWPDDVGRPPNVEIASAEVLPESHFTHQNFRSIFAATWQPRLEGEWLFKQNSPTATGLLLSPHSSERVSSAVRVRLLPAAAKMFNKPNKGTDPIAAEMYPKRLESAVA